MEHVFDLESLKSAVELSVDEVEAVVKNRGPRAGIVTANGATAGRVDAGGRPEVFRQTCGIDVDKRQPGPNKYQELAAARGIAWREGFDARVINYWASDERVDRHGDIVRQSWVLDEFTDNPLILYGHDWDMPPIGNSIHEEVVQRKDDGYKGPALRLLSLFHDQGFAADVFDLVQSGFLRAGSVGFFPGKVIRVDDPEERQKLGLEPGGLIFEDNELVEFTIASVPANVGAHVAALAAAKGAGHLRPESVQVVRELARRQIRRGAGDKARWLELDAAIRETWRSVFPDLRPPTHSELDVPLLFEELERQAACGGTATRDQSLDDFSVGDQVEWEDGNGKTQHGEVEAVYSDLETVLAGRDDKDGRYVAAVRMEDLRLREVPPDPPMRLDEVMASLRTIGEKLDGIQEQLDALEDRSAGLDAGVSDSDVQGDEDVAPVLERVLELSEQTAAALGGAH